ncbi:MAG: type II methionyl aminopeptidase [Crenarchaeota archaeon]|nr:type II methionyl aminopeptidase [Thermoproteota archaeon]
MDEEVVKAYIRAGEIAARVRDEAARMIEPGRRLIDICEYAENRIVELGGAPAFPCNISINSVAAHYTPVIGDEAVVPEGAVVKLDVGVHVDGYIADTAVTVALDERWTPLIEAVREALERALETVRPGARFADTGRAIAEAIQSRGFRPIVNLGGHSLARYRVHAGESIPNAFDPAIPGRYSPGKAYAIEPFGTNGEGLVVEDRETVTIYSLARLGLRRRLTSLERSILEEVQRRFRTLPFTERWLSHLTSDVQALRKSLRRLARMGFLTQYPALVERRRGMVAQFEHTVLITDGGEVIVTTSGSTG